MKFTGTSFIPAGIYIVVYELCDMILVMCCIIYTECDFSNDIYFIYEIYM